MKTSARFLAMLLAVVMIASAALSVSAFSDVTAGVDHATAISVLSQLGVIGGYEDGTFKPEQKVTRAEMAKLVYVLRTTFVDAGDGTVKFNDAKDHWAKGYISWCAGKDIIGGYGDGNFGPNDNVTYDQALKMVCGALGYNEWDSALWPTDVRSKAIKELKLNAGIDDAVKGSDKLTRAQVAQIMYNALFVDMKETKNEETLFPGTTITVYLPVPKVLAEDVWGFAVNTLTITAVKADDEGDSITTEDGEEFLEDLGLEEYQGKVADLIGLKVTKIAKDDEVIGVSIKGAVTDGVKIAYDKTFKFITIDGVKYTAENFGGKAKNQVAFYDLDGEKSDVAVFDGEVLSDAFKAIIWKEAVTRVIDVDGDGIVDRFVMVNKAAYEVDSVKTTKEGKIVTAKALNGKLADIVAPIANFTAEVKEGDIIVAAKLNNTVYAEVVAPVTTYAKALNSKEITLVEGGKAAYTEYTVLGVDAQTFVAANVLGEEKAGLYWVYNGQILDSDLSAAAASEYKIAILKDIIAGDTTIDPVTKESKTPYNAVLIIDGVETTVALDTTNAVVVAGTTLNAEEALEAYGSDTPKGGKVTYKYALVAAYAEEEGLYTLTINADLDADEDKYVKVAAGTKLAYNATTKIFTVGEGKDAIKKVVLDDNSAIFYTYTVKAGKAEGFIDIAKYTKANVPTETWSTELTDVAYLAYDETTKMYTLIAAVINGDDEMFEVASDIPYETDGRLILYAPVESETVLVDGKTYNSYVFMDNATLTTGKAIVDTVESTEANATEEGSLYAWNPKDKVYDEITSASDLDTIELITITDVTNANGYTLINAAFSVDETVTIWGLGEAKENDSYKQLTFAELAEMFELVAEYNEEEKASLEIRAICTYYIPAAGKDKVLSSIIVEIFEADEEGVVASVNDTIFDNFVVVE